MLQRTVKLSSDDKQIVFAEVYAPGIPDSDGEYMTAEDIELMAHKFMKNAYLRKVDTQHNNNSVDACVIESFIARPGDPEFIEGSWVVGMHVEDAETWARIKKGELNGFSMEAYVTRTDEEIEINVPPIIIGKTHKSEAGVAGDDHIHTFYVTYDPEGNFLGGITDDINGHKHQIKRGSVTEDSGNPPHHHKFHFVENLRRAA